MSSEICAWLGSKALGSGALAREMLIGRPLVRKALTRERGAGQRKPGRNWYRAWSRGLGSETLGMKPAGFGGAGNYPRASLGLRQESGKSCLNKLTSNTSCSVYSTSSHATTHIRFSCHILFLLFPCRGCRSGRRRWDICSSASGGHAIDERRRI